jgi:hypothetical protein
VFRLADSDDVAFERAPTFWDYRFRCGRVDVWFRHGLYGVGHALHASIFLFNHSLLANIDGKNFWTRYCMGPLAVSEIVSVLSSPLYHSI